MNEQQYDRFLHIQTTGNQQGFPMLAHYHRYEPTPYEVLDLCFDHYALMKGDCLVDFGCGKGRVPFYVHHRFHIPTLGIEMNDDYVQDALRNKAQYTKKFSVKQATIDFHCVMAQNYKVQPNNNVFFFFNPFSIQIFRKVVNNILQSVERNPRKIHIILYYPTFEYVQFLQYETNFEMEDELLVPFLSTHNRNERIVLFTYN